MMFRAIPSDRRPPGQRFSKAYKDRLFPNPLLVTP
jgi:hypothetical protein